MLVSILSMYLAMYTEWDTTEDVTNNSSSPRQVACVPILSITEEEELWAPTSPQLRYKSETKWCRGPQCLWKFYRGNNRPCTNQSNCGKWLPCHSNLHQGYINHQNGANSQRQLNWGITTRYRGLILCNVKCHQQYNSSIDRWLETLLWEGIYISVKVKFIEPSQRVHDKKTPTVLILLITI